MMGVWGKSNEDEKWQVRGERRSVIRSANILDMGTEESKSAARCLVWPTATRNPFAVGGSLWRDWGRRGSQGTQVWKCIWDAWWTSSRDPGQTIGLRGVGFMLQTSIWESSEYRWSLTPWNHRRSSKLRGRRDRKEKSKFNSLSLLPFFVQRHCSFLFNIQSSVWHFLKKNHYIDTACQVKGGQRSRFLSPR